MKEKFTVLFLRLKAGYHWNRMIAKQDKSGLLHSSLMGLDEGYRQSSHIYNQTISQLSKLDAYTTARSQMKAP